MAWHAGRAGLRRGKPSQSHYPCVPSRRCTSPPKPAGLSPAAPSGAPRAPFPAGSLPRVFPALPRLPRGGGSSSGGRAGASPSRPVTRHPGSARPHPGSSLFPRWAPRSGAASSRVALWRFRAPPSPRPRGASGSVHPARSEPGPFFFAWFLRCGLRAELGGGSAPSPEPAQVSVRGPGRVAPAPGGGGKVEAGALGRAALEPEVRAGDQAGLRG